MEIDDRGVSPVIGTILLIAITVVIAGTVGYFAMTESPGQTAPTVAMSVDHADDQLYHNGGDNLDTANLSITVDGNSVTTSGSFAVGDNLYLGSDVTSENRIVVVHNPSDSLLFESGT